MLVFGFRPTHYCLTRHLIFVAVFRSVYYHLMQRGHQAQKRECSHLSRVPKQVNKEKTFKEPGLHSPMGPTCKEAMAVRSLKVEEPDPG